MWCVSAYMQCTPLTATRLGQPSPAIDAAREEALASSRKVAPVEVSAHLPRKAKVVLSKNERLNADGRLFNVNILATSTCMSMFIN